MGVLMTWDDWNRVQYFNPDENWGDWTKSEKNVIFLLYKILFFKFIFIKIILKIKFSNH